MKKVERKLWFVTLVALPTVGSTFWLFWAVGLGSPVAMYTVPRLVLFLVCLFSFQRLYAHLIWSILLWLAPTLVGEKRLNS
jgi:hypothetical protein